MIQSMKRVVNYVKGQEPRWIIGFTMVYLGNPVVFMLYLCIVGPISYIFSPFKDSWLMPAREWGGIVWINPVYFILTTLPVYIAWIALIGDCRKIDLDKLLDHYVTQYHHVLYQFRVF